MAEERTTEGYRIGRVFSNSLKVLRSNFLPFMGLSLLIMSPQFLVSYALSRSTLADPAGMPSPMLLVLSVILPLLLTGLLTATLCHGTFQHLSGQRVSMGDSVRTGLRVLPVVIAVSLLYSLATMGGALLLLVPGLIVMTMFVVSVPAAVIERPGVFRSFARSRILTKGDRWKVFGTYLLFILLSIVVGLLIGFVIGFGLGTAPQDQGVIALAGSLIESVVNAVVYALGAVLVAVIYNELRIVKEGATAEQIAAVFD